MFFRRKCTPVLRAPRNCETCCERASKRGPSAAKRPAPSAATLYLARIRRQHPQVFRIHLTDTVLSNGWRELCSSATRSRYLLYAPLHSVLMLSSQFWPMLSMSRGVINCAKLFLSHRFSRIKSFDQRAVDRDPFLTSTTSAKIGKTAISHSKRFPLRGCIEHEKKSTRKKI